MLNHEKTIANVKEIESILKNILSKQNNVNGYIEEWGGDSSYNPAFIAQKITALKGDFVQFAGAFSDKLYNHALAIEEAETELLNQSINVNDTALTNAVSLVTALGNDMPMEQQRQIAEQFKGDYYAEKTLAALYEKYNMAYTVKFTDFYTLCHNLRLAIAVFNSDCTTTAGENLSKVTASYYGVEQACNDILSAINSDYKIDLGVKMDSFMAAVCAAAGLEIVS